MWCRSSWCRWCRFCKEGRRCCVDEVTSSIWQQFSSRLSLFWANTGVCSRVWDFNHRRLASYWASGDSPARKSQPPKSIPSWPTLVPKGKWLNFGSTSTHQKNLGIRMNSDESWLNPGLSLNSAMGWFCFKPHFTTIFTISSSSL